MNHDLQEKLTRLFSGAKHLPTGSVIDVDIMHDDKCPAILTGRMGDCTCQPEFRFRERVKESIGEDEKERRKC